MVSRRPGDPKFELENVALTSAEAKKTRCFQNAQKIRKKRKKGGSKRKKGKKDKRGKRGQKQQKKKKKKKEKKKKGKGEEKTTIYKNSRSSAPVAAVMLSSK